MCGCTKITAKKRERIINYLFSQKNSYKSYTIFNLIIDFLTGKLLKASRGIQEARLLNCQKCEYLVFKSHCSLNGYYLKFKTQFLKSSCPGGKW